MFPCFIVPDANYDSITCNSNPVQIWPLPRCNEDPDCRNPRGFRIATYTHTRVTENKQNEGSYNSRTIIDRAISDPKFCKQLFGKCIRLCENLCWWRHHHSMTSSSWSSFLSFFTKFTLFQARLMPWRSYKKWNSTILWVR